MQEILKQAVSLRSGFRIERTAKRMKQAAAQALKDAGIDVTVDQWVILDQLQEEAISQQEIGQRTFKDAPTVTRILDLLDDKSLILRSAHPSDRRKTLISLTPEGEKQVARIQPIILEVRRNAYEGLNEKQINQLIQLMDHIYNNLQE